MPTDECGSPGRLQRLCLSIQRVTGLHRASGTAPLPQLCLLWSHEQRARVCYRRPRALIGVFSPQVTGLGTAKDAGIAIFGFLFGMSFDLFPAWYASPRPVVCAQPGHTCRSSQAARTVRSVLTSVLRPRWAILASVTADIAGFLLIWALYTHQLSAPYPVVWCIFVLAYGCNAGYALGPLKYTLGNFPEFRGMAAGFLKPMDGLCAAIYTQARRRARPRCIFLLRAKRAPVLRCGFRCVLSGLTGDNGVVLLLPAADSPCPRAVNQRLPAAPGAWPNAILPLRHCGCCSRARARFRLRLPPALNPTAPPRLTCRRSCQQPWPS